MSISSSVKAIIEDKNPDSSNRGLSSLLFCLSLIYGFGVKARSVFYKIGLFKTKKLSVPVISVGNLTLGGTGKTPVVAAIVNILLKKGIRTAILSRGYKGESKGKINIVSDGKSILLAPISAGDEPFMLAKMFKSVPVITGQDRFITGEYAISNFKVDALILDDSFQRISLKRDLDILVVDAENPVGNGYLFPRGSLREQVSGAKRADIAILTRCKDDNSFTKPFASKLPWCYAKTQIIGLCNKESNENFSFSLISGKPIFIFCGIGSPDSFKNSINETNAVIAGHIFFNDHHSYTEKDVKEIANQALKSGAKFLITTEKDFVRLRENFSFPMPLFFLKVELEIFKGLDLLENKIEELFSL